LGSNGQIEFNGVLGSRPCRHPEQISTRLNPSRRFDRDLLIIAAGHLHCFTVEFNRRLFPEVVPVDRDRTVCIVGFRPINYRLILILVFVLGLQRTGERNQTAKRQKAKEFK
jgi:hypothetical protein